MPNREATRRWSDYSKGSRTAAVSYDVIGCTTGDQARATCGLEKNSQHFEDPELKVDDWSITQPGVNFYRVTFSFSIPEDGNEHPGTSVSGTNPLTLPPTIRWDPGTAQEPIDRTADGEPIVNSAFDALDPPLTRLVPTLFLTYTRYESAPFQIQKYFPFITTTNSNDLTVQGLTVKKGQMFCHNIAPIAEYTPSAKYIQVAYQFELRQDGFKGRALDQGLRGWKDTADDGPGISELFTSGGEQISYPVRLNGHGEPMDLSLRGNYAASLIPCPKAVDAEIEPTAYATFLKFKIYPEKDFGQLGL